MKLVIKFGGSLLYDDSMKLNVDRIKEMAQYASELSQVHELCVVIGGGKITRMYSNVLSELSPAELDLVATRMTKVHAYILSRYISQYVDVKLINHHEELLTPFQGVIVSGGFYPGQSTNGAAATCAELFGADLLVNYFSYDQIYSSDPEKGKLGEPLSLITYSKMRELIKNFKQVPGHYELFDANALNAVERSKIPVLFLNGERPRELAKHFKQIPVGTLMMEVRR